MRVPAILTVVSITTVTLSCRCSVSRHCSAQLRPCLVSGRTMNAFVNKNALEIVSELKEPLGESFSVAFKDIMNNMLGHVPLDIWLIDK